MGIRSRIKSFFRRKTKHTPVVAAANQTHAPAVIVPKVEVKPEVPLITVPVEVTHKIMHLLYCMDNQALTQLTRTCKTFQNEPGYYGLAKDKKTLRKIRNAAAKIKRNNPENTALAAEIMRLKTSADIPNTGSADPILKLNLSNLDLSGIDLSQGDFAGVSFAHSNLSKCNLANSDLRDCNFSYANLAGACLRGAYLSGQNLNMNKANLNNANITDLVMESQASRWDGEPPTTYEWIDGRREITLHSMFQQLSFLTQLRTCKGRFYSYYHNAMVTEGEMAPIKSYYNIANHLYSLHASATNTLQYSNEVPSPELTGFAQAAPTFRP